MIADQRKQIGLLKYEVEQLKNSAANEKKKFLNLRNELDQMKKNFFNEMVSMKSKDQLGMRLENG